MYLDFNISLTELKFWDQVYGQSLVARSLFKRLFKKKYKIRTSCLVSNERAFRFLHSVGFISYYKTMDFYYLWLPQKRFQNTEIYKRVNNK